MPRSRRGTRFIDAILYICGRRKFMITALPLLALLAFAQEAPAPAQTPTPAPSPVVESTPAAAPDDARLADIVRIVKSGISEGLIAEQIKQSGNSYKLTMNDLLYFQQNGRQDSCRS